MACILTQQTSSYRCLIQLIPGEGVVHNNFTSQPFRKSRKVWQNVKETVVSDAGHGVAEMFRECFTTMQKYQIYCERLQVMPLISAWACFSAPIFTFTRQPSWTSADR